LRPEWSAGESTSEIASAVLMTCSRQAPELLNTWQSPVDIRQRGGQLSHVW
jgi:hypothetical protein